MNADSRMNANRKTVKNVTGTVLRWTVAVALILTLAFPGTSQSGVPQGSGGPAPTAQDPAGALEDGTMGMKPGDFFNNNFVHLMPHEIAGSGKWTTFYNVNLFQVFVVLGIALLFFLVARSFASAGDAPWIVRVFRGWCHWLRDEVICNVMGEEEGQKWAPLFIYIFFFIAFLNLVGLIPGSVTATACVFVTGALAMITLAIMLVGGMKTQGVVAFWKNLLPHGLPVALIPLMAFVEVVGLFVKPIALTVRLFANLLAGHLLIYSLIGIIFVFAQMFEMGVLSWATAIPSVGMAVFINIIEALVVLLQAYIFTYLSVLFVQQSLHPAH